MRTSHYLLLAFVLFAIGAIILAILPRDQLGRLDGTSKFWIMVAFALASLFSLVAFTQTFRMEKREEGGQVNCPKQKTVKIAKHDPVTVDNPQYSPHNPYAEEDPTFFDNPYS
jgi:hypothetical protein